MRADVAEDQNYDLLLGQPYISQTNLDIDQATKVLSQRFRDRRLNVEYISSEEFEGALQLGEQVYAMFLDKVNDSIEKAPFTLLDQLSDLATVFNIDKASGLLDYSLSDYAINLVDSKTPLYRPIYPLGERKLATLRKYIDNSLELGRLRHSTSAAGSLILFVPKKDRELRLYVNY